MSTFLELQTEVATNIIDLPTAVSALVPTYIKRAVKSIQNKHNFKVMETELSVVTTVSDASLGSVPSNFKEWLFDPFYLTNNGDWNKMIMAPNISAIRSVGINTTDTGYPIYILHNNATTDAGAAVLTVYPLPDGNSDFSDGEYRIQIPYVKYLTALSASGDTNWFTVNADEYIINLATSYGFAADWDEQRMALWAQLADNKYKEIVLKDKRERLAGVDTFVPHYQGVNQSRVRR